MKRPIPSGAVARAHRGLVRALAGAGLALAAVAASGASVRYQDLHDFAGPDGANPTGLRLAPSGRVFGATTVGGVELQAPPFGSYGTVYQLAAGGRVHTLHAFLHDGQDGLFPSAPVELPTGALVGMTLSGGIHQHVDSGVHGTDYDGGTIWRILPGGRYDVIHSFDSDDHGCFNGEDFSTSVAADGSVLGTTSSGGPANLGCLLRLGVDGQVTILHAFAGDDGTGPHAPVLGPDGAYYGTTAGGGTGGGGVVYRLGADDSFSVFHEFGRDRPGMIGYPSNLTLGPDGQFYGSINVDIFGRQSVFRLALDGRLVNLGVFPNAKGPDGFSDFLLGRDGAFYASVNSMADGHGNGGLVRMSTDGVVTPLYVLADDFSQGAFSTAPIELPDGSLLTTGYDGGKFGPGTINRFTRR